MMSLSVDKQADISDAFNTTSRYLDDILNINNFDFEIVNFPYSDGDVSRSTSYGVYISQLIRFVRASGHVADFNTRNILLTQKLLKQCYLYH